MQHSADKWETTQLILNDSLFLCVHALILYYWMPIVYTGTRSLAWLLMGSWVKAAPQHMMSISFGSRTCQEYLLCMCHCYEILFFLYFCSFSFFKLNAHTAKNRKEKNHSKKSEDKCMERIEWPEYVNKIMATSEHAYNKMPLFLFMEQISAFGGCGKGLCIHEFHWFMFVSHDDNFELEKLLYTVQTALIHSSMFWMLFRDFETVSFVHANIPINTNSKKRESNTWMRNDVNTSNQTMRH